MSPRPDLKSALDCAQRWPVFPLLGKTPAIRNEDHNIERGRGGSRMAAIGREVQQLWDMAQTSHPSARAFNIGVATGSQSDLLVIDLDIHKAETPADKSRLTKQLYELLGLDPKEVHDTLPCRVHQTQSGGRHFIFSTPEAGTIKNLPIADYIDIRAEGGYVVWPPSAGYEVVQDIDPPAPPPGMLQRLRKMQREHAKATGRPRGGNQAMSVEDLESAVLRGVNLHDALFELGRRHCAEGLPKMDSVDRLTQLLLQSDRKRTDEASWRDRLRDLERTVDDAYLRSSPPMDMTKAILRAALAGGGPLSGKVTPHGAPPPPKPLEGAAEMTLDSILGQRIEPISWVIPQVIPRGNLVSITGPSGVGKTRICAALAAALAAGRTEALGLPASPAARVAWFGNEERSSDLMRRIKGAAQRLDLSGGLPLLLRGKDAAGGGSLRLLKADGTEDTARVSGLIEELLEFGADVAIFDPLISLGVEDENASASVAELTSVFHRICGEARCAVLVIHHSPKDRAAPPDQLRGDYAAWRGSGAIYSALDVGLTAMPYVPGEVHLGGKGDLRAYLAAQRERRIPKFVAIDTAKMREGVELDPLVWRIRNWELGDGQGGVGVVEPSSPAEASAAWRSLRMAGAIETLKTATRKGDAKAADLKLQADALSAMVTPGKQERHHVTIPVLIDAGVLPEGARADRDGDALLAAFRNGVTVTDETNAVRVVKRGRSYSIKLSVPKPVTET